MESRTNEIVTLLKETKYLSVTELATRLNYSKSTIRRDLAALAKRHLVQRISGGALLVHDQDTEDPITVRRYTNASQKKAIADFAIDFIDNFSSVFIDSSSTCIFLAKRLKEKHHLFVVTPNFYTATELTQHTDAAVYCVGGRMTDQRCAGAESEMAIHNYHLDIAILSCRGLDAEFGLSERVEAEAALKRAAVKQANQVILLVDSSKFDKQCLFKSVGLNMIDVLITDTEPSAKMLERLRQANSNMDIIYPGSED